MSKIMTEVTKTIVGENVETGEKTPIQIKIITPINEGCTCLICPNCGAHEVDHDWKPTTEEEKKTYIFGCRFNIRAFKVDDWSHCLQCDCWFDLKGNIEGGKKK